MDRPGEKLRQARERLKLTFRDVVEASQKIAALRHSEEFSIALSRLSDIENKGTVPTIYRLYTLCAIYRLDWKEVLNWYQVPVDLMAADGLQIPLEQTHEIRFSANGIDSVPVSLEQDLDLNKTSFLTHLINRWGKMPFSLLNASDQRHLRYGFVGMADWSMYPILQPGSLILIDQSQRKIAVAGWTSELERPIYFLEHRDGCCVGWCTPVDDRLLLQPHPSSQEPPRLFRYADVDVIGQITGVTMLLESKKRRHARNAVVPVGSLNP